MGRRVGEPITADHVAGSVHAGLGGPIELVHLDLPAVVQLNLGGVQVEGLDYGRAPDVDEQHLGLERFLAVLAFDLDRHAVVGLPEAHGSAFVLVITRMPRRSKAFSSSAEISASSVGTVRSRSSTSVTSVPKSLYRLANSTPTAPLPRMMTDAGGSSVLVTTASLEMTFPPSSSRPGRVATAEPVARRTLAVSSSVPSSSPSCTFTRLGSMKLPVPRNTCTLFFFIRLRTPCRSWSTT